MNQYPGHARHEEGVFLPLSEQILGRNGKHRAALGTALHLCQTVPELLKARAFRA